MPHDDLDLGTLKKPVFAVELAVAAAHAHKAGKATATLHTAEGGTISILAQPLSDKTPITVALDGPVVIAPCEGYPVDERSGEAPLPLLPVHPRAVVSTLPPRAHLLAIHSAQ